MCLHTNVLYTDGAIMCMCPFLLVANCAFSLTGHISLVMCVCRYYIITDILMSMFVSFKHHFILLIIL